MTERLKPPIAGLVTALQDYLPKQRWYAGKARTIDRVAIEDRIPLPGGGTYLMLFRVDFAAGPSERYLLPLSEAAGDAAREVEQQSPEFVVARGDGVVVYDATPIPELWQTALDGVGQQARWPGERGVLQARTTPAFDRLGGLLGSRELHRHTGQQSHSSADFGQRLILKLFRKLAEGQNPDVEIGQFLADVAPTAPTPPLAGWLHYQNEEQAITLGMLQAFVPNQGDAWTFTLQQLGRLCAGIGSQPVPEPPPSTIATLWSLAKARPELSTLHWLAEHLEYAELLGRRTGELHVALASSSSQPDFAPEPFTPSEQAALQDAMQRTIDRGFRLLSERKSTLPPSLQDIAADVARLEPQLRERLNRLRDQLLHSPRIRVHGDYHLGQVLWTGSDFVIIDFEGEPDRPIAERRMKQSPLKDVAGMLRSFHYAANADLMGFIPGLAPDRNVRPWLDAWYVHSAAAFLRGYQQSAVNLLPVDAAEQELLLELFVLDKLVYELAYELNSRPDWAVIPLSGLLELQT